MCADVKDKTKNVNRDLAAVLAFIEYDQFITWAWDSGTRASGLRRTTPPLNTHDDFVNVVKRWIAASAPCRGVNPLPQTFADARTFVYCDDDMEPEL